MSREQQIVPGISISGSGQATIDPSLTDVLFDLAIQLDDASAHPVDVEHVVAAIVLAARAGELDADAPLASDDHALQKMLLEHVNAVFAQHDGQVGMDD